MSQNMIFQVKEQLLMALMSEIIRSRHLPNELNLISYLSNFDVQLEMLSIIYNLRRTILKAVTVWCLKSKLIVRFLAFSQLVNQTHHYTGFHT